MFYLLAPWATEDVDASPVSCALGPSNAFNPLRLSCELDSPEHASPLLAVCRPFVARISLGMLLKRASFESCGDLMARSPEHPRFTEAVDEFRVSLAFTDSTSAALYSASASMGPCLCRWSCLGRVPVDSSAVGQSNFPVGRRMFAGNTYEH